MKTIIFDLDGTLANIDHRLHHIQNGNRRWDKFFADCVNDAPVGNVCELFLQLRHTDCYNIVIVSGRSDEVREQTMNWLLGHNLHYSKLIMRKAGDYRADDIIKEEILDKLLDEGHDILFTVDDRQRVVDMWRRRGITCLQCAAWKEEGDHQPKKKGLLTLMIGPSGSGKSTWLQNERYLSISSNPNEWFEACHFGIHSSHIISSDQFRQDLCGDFRDQTRNDEVFKAVHTVAKARIDSGLPTVIDATHIKRADRLAAVKLAEGGLVRYLVLNRSMEDKRRDGGWRNEVGFDLLAKHEQTFQSQLKDILRGDGLENVEVVDLRSTLNE